MACIVKEKTIKKEDAVITDTDSVASKKSRLMENGLNGPNVRDPVGNSKQPRIERENV
jgi:hypothetical protein